MTPPTIVINKGNQKAFPEYDKNDGGHNITHILEVIRRSFALNDTFLFDLLNLQWI